MLLNDLVSPANRAIAALLRSPLHVVASKGLMILTWEGRKSGRTYSVPVGYQRRDDLIVVLLSKPDAKTWWRNFREPWPAELLVQRDSVRVVGELVPSDQPEFFEYVERTLDQLPWMGSQFGKIKYDKATGLTDNQRHTIAGHAAVVVFTPQDPAP